MRQKGKIFAVTLVALLVCSAIALVGMKVYADSNKDTIADGVFIETVSLGGTTEEEARRLVDDYIKTLKSRKITVNVDGNKVATKLEKIGYEVVANDYIDQAVNLGKSGNLIKRYKELQDVKHNKLVYDLEFTIDNTQTKEFIEKKCAKYEIEPVNATIKKQGGSFVVSDDKTGRAVQVQETIDKIKSVILQGWDGKDVSVDAVMIDAEPQVTKETMAKCKDLLGEYSTSFASSSSDRVANLENAARLINGSVILPGEEFSTSQKLIPFTEENGYKAAGAYLNGKVVDSIGGGVCQASTTLYNALLKAELEITQRFNHSMIVSYIPASMDAAISEGYKDLKFKNNTNVPIYIEAYTVGRTIYFKVYGEETRNLTNRKVVYESEVIETIQPGADIERKDPTKPVGYRYVEQSAHTGYKAKLWKIVYENGEQVSKEQVNYSSYAAQPAYVVVGTKEEKKPEPEKTDEEEKEKDEEKEDGNKTDKPDKTDDTDKKPSKKPSVDSDSNKGDADANKPAAQKVENDKKTEE